MEDEEGDLDFWKQRALAAELELEEHQETSAELEAELEKELKEKEAQLRQWQQKYQQLDNDTGRELERLQTDVKEYTQQVERLEAENEDIGKSNRFQISCIRELEQSVDDLERAKREALHTICTLENTIADQMEQCAILEADLDEKAKLEAECQRLRDQARDLSQDLLVERRKESKMEKLLMAHQISPGSYSSSPSTSLERLNRSTIQDGTPKTSGKAATPKLSPSVKRQPLNESGSSISTVQHTPSSNQNTPQQQQSYQPNIVTSNGHDKENNSSSSLPNNKSLEEITEGDLTRTPEAKRKHASNTPPASLGRPGRDSDGNAVTPQASQPSVNTPGSLNNSQRQSAVTLVGDLLNKIGVLENKLSSCRKFIRDSPWRESGVQRRKNSEKSGSGASLNEPQDTRSTSTINSDPHHHQYSPVQTRASRQRRIYTDKKQ